MSGTFDTLHYGHLNLIKRAKSECDYLVVGVHPAVKHKNCKTHHSFKERFENIREIFSVDLVVPAPIEDDQACFEYDINVLFVGDDYKNSERFLKYERSLKGIAEIKYFPRTKNISSSQMRRIINEE